MAIPDYTPTQILRYGAYICIPIHDRIASAPVPALVDRLGLHNEFDPHPPGATIAFVRGREEPEALLHISAETAAPVDEFCKEVACLLSPASGLHIHRGVLRSPSFTGAAMHEFAYARQVTQQPGDGAPNAFFFPMSKTPEWWAKSWMERHTYFLPRYDNTGRMLSAGHALAAAAGIPCLYRRTYRYPTSPAPEGYYDFLNYFECSDAAVPTFHAVCAALRDVSKNPEWKFVREGPMWWGRRVRAWSDFFTYEHTDSRSSAGRKHARLHRPGLHHRRVEGHRRPARSPALDRAASPPS